MCYLLHSTINKADPTGPSFVAPVLVFISVVRCHKRDIGKLQMAPNRAARPALGCTQLTWIICTSKWRRDWLHHYLYLWELLTCWMHILNQTPMHNPQDMPRGFFTVQTMGGAQYYIEPWLHETQFHMKQENLILKNWKIHLMEQRELWTNTKIGTDTCIHTHDNIRTIHTSTHGFCTVDTVGRTSIWYTADFAGFPTYKACQGLIVYHRYT
jgi:hypothetical protein